MSSATMKIKVTHYWPGCLHVDLVADRRKHPEWEWRDDMKGAVRLLQCERLTDCMNSLLVTAAHPFRAILHVPRSEGATDPTGDFARMEQLVLHVFCGGNLAEIT